ncbi:MAG: hypothetical protein DRN04_10820 [Thermoprotei archaeon]|nr:MAG: hypothetical protein DRN04_10820 [Thermoprotei archaeon]
MCEKRYEDIIEDLREKYRPKEIRVLFVAESPPKPSDTQEVRFFYNKNTVLYYATFIAFHRVYSIKEEEFLTMFQKLGCYLYDLLPAGRSWRGVGVDERNRALDKLSRFVRGNKPRLIVVVFKSRIARVIEKKLKDYNVKSLYFPTQRNIDKYVEGLEEVLSDAIANNILPRTL